ncbi:hypothetical protein QF037_010233 [Streptomyces canus]|nr:hypothetical protein [Streptomyces canus]
MRSRRRAIAVDGKCLRGAKRPDGSRVFVLSAVRHGDGVTLASREIGAKTNEIPEFAPCSIRSTTRISRGPPSPPMPSTSNATTPPICTSTPWPWKDIPVVHRDDVRGHGRHEQRIVQVVTVAGLLFPYAAQVLRIKRRRRLYGAKKWSSETVHAITDLAAEEANAAAIAS